MKMHLLEGSIGIMRLILGEGIKLPDPWLEVSCGIARWDPLLGGFVGERVG